MVTDWNCARKRFLQYEYAPPGFEKQVKGVVKSATSLELFLGQAIHDALAFIATIYQSGQTLDLDELCRTAGDQVSQAILQAGTGEVDNQMFAAEQSCLVQGIIRGFYRQVWPGLIAEYSEVLFIEQEMEYPHDGLVFMSKPDLILSGPSGVVYIEYKSTSSKKPEWINQWDTAVQLHSTVKAVEATTGIVVDQVIIQGLYKGYNAYNRQNSPFCYGYRKSGQPPFHTSQQSYEYKSGWTRFPVWEAPGGVKGWVEGMPPDLLADQYLTSPPIYVNNDLVNAFFTQRSIREHQIFDTMQWLGNLDTDQETKDELMAAVFPQKFDQCQPGFGRACEYRQICHGGLTDPLFSGGFVAREPHHQKELEMLGGSE